MFRIMLSLSLLFMVAASATRLPAAAIVKPPGLGLGDEYRLVFSTSSTIAATSGDVVTYNAFANSVASANPQLDGISWSAIVSTSNIDARDNTNTNPSLNGIGVPIYNLAGSRIAQNYTDLWDSTIENPISVDEFGDQISTNPWTGTNTSGLEFANSWGLGTSTVAFGYSTQNDSQWIAGGSAGSSQLRPIYAISDVLTIVPEPSSCVIAMIALCLHFKRSR